MHTENIHLGLTLIVGTLFLELNLHWLGQTMIVWHIYVEYGVYFSDESASYVVKHTLAVIQLFDEYVKSTFVLNHCVVNHVVIAHYLFGVLCFTGCNIGSWAAVEI
jgi:hypothetical protein